MTIKRAIAVLLVASMSAVGCDRTAPNSLPTGQQVTIAPGKVELSTDRFTTTQQPGAAIPASFPKDIPIYPGAVYRISSADKGQVFSMVLDVPMGDVTAIEAYYRDHFTKNGWTVAHDHRSKAGGGMVQYRKDNRRCRVTVGTTDEGGTALGFFLSD